jgi:uncharacterized membrane protein YedE/YeeE
MWRTNEDGASVAVQRKVYGSSLSGILLALGLAISGMIRAPKVYSFLDIGALFRPGSTWDPTLATVLSSAVLASMISYEFVDEWNKFNKGKLLSKPVVASDWGIPTSKVIDAPLIAGSFLFGIGWGVASLLPDTTMSFGDGFQPLWLDQDSLIVSYP